MNKNNIMNNKISQLSLLNSIWLRCSINRRKQFIGILIVMIFSSFAEVLSLGSVLPFLGVLTDPERVFEEPYVANLLNILAIKSPNELLLPVAGIFISLTLFSGLVRLFLIWLNTKFSYALGADLSLEIYERTLYQPYLVQISRNSSEVISGISGKVDRVINIINMALTLIGSIFILVAILGTILIINPIVAICSFFSFGLVYGLILVWTKSYVLENSVNIARESSALIKALQEGLGGIRDILIDGTQSIYCKIYQKSDRILRASQSSNLFISQCPRYLVETIGMILIAVIAVLVIYNPSSSTISIIPLLGLIAFGAQRMLPVMQQAYGAWTTMLGAKASLIDVISLLDQPMPNEIHKMDAAPLSFNQEIVLRNISFRYDNAASLVLNNINIRISKGSSVGIVGKTGGGKSTLLDLIMGLLHPTSGYIEVDGKKIDENNYRNWQSCIAHVPQSIFLADTSIAENIAFGLHANDIDLNLLQEVSRQAQLFDLIESWPLKFKTLVGERGVRLSGGQRQRIGIARALYKRASILILDEATSALDIETEELIISGLKNTYSELVTIIMVTHRVHTLKNTDYIFEVSNSGVKNISKISPDIFDNV